jgi:NADPH2:quinone reductase
MLVEWPLVRLGDHVESCLGKMLDAKKTRERLIGNAGGIALHATVMPFILRGVRLIGIDSAATAMPLRREIWRRLGTDLYPAQLAEVTHCVPFSQLPEIFAHMLQGKSRGRTVVQFAY